ncbi:MAG: alpha-2-macroglobulin [Prevotellaceae bacterium]|jgi:uncharacterized protein YfaS (alpha-2-macroglobulin family)|nr:alpha-2-macroglobulin [Prevotellaceae bacterium]
MKKNILFILVAVALTACSTKNIVPVEEFAPYIAAFTGGGVQQNGTVRVELTAPSPAYKENGEAKGLFKFSPSIKGKAYWINDRTIEFVPKENTLKNGETYTATFRLSKVLPDIEKRLKNFVFTFHIEEKTCFLSLSPIDIPDSKTANVSGLISFSDGVALEDVQKALSAKTADGQKLTPTVEAVDAENYNFFINNIERTDADKEIEITVNGKIFDIEQSEVQTIVVPARNVFKVLSAEAIRETDARIEIVFSDPLATQDLRGFVTIAEQKKFTMQTEGNRLTIYFDPQKTLTLNLTIHKGIKNSDGETLKEDFVKTISLESLKPQVKLIKSGNILPNAANLKLPFRAVNLKAVDIRIIQIYENNILQFLQENDLNGSDELRRVGRLVYKKTLKLNQPPEKYAFWQNYSLDLSKIIQREAGAIYRIEMSFKQEYSTYSCADNLSEETQTQNIIGNEITESEDKFWDTPYSYYYYENPNYNWEDYDWRERENPCNPTYYMTSDAMVHCNVLTSNLGVIAKSNSENKVWVSVADIMTAKAVGGAQITIYDYQLQNIGSAAADADGFALIQAKRKPFIVVAAQGKQKTYLKLTDGDENMLTRFDIEGKRIEKGLKGYIYGERGVWRPGDTLHISFILHDAEKKIPDNHPVILEVYNAKGQFYNKQIAAHGTNGFYVFHLPTSQEDGTGLWNAYIKVGGATFHKNLRIEAIKPNRLKVNLDLGTKRIDAKNGQITAKLTSAWLTGATAHDMTAKAEMTLRKTKTQFKGYEQYIFNSPTSDFSSATFEIFNGKTDQNGEANVSFSIPKAENATGMLNAVVTTRVFEAGGDASVFTQELPFSPFDAYVGLNTNIAKNKYIETGKQHTYNIVSLSADGKPLDNQDILVKIYKVEWSWWWENEGEDNFSRYVNSSSYSPIAVGTVKTENGKGSFSHKVPYPEWGRYLVYVKNLKSGHAAGTLVWIDWAGNDSHGDSEDPSGIKMLSFSLDKKSYEVGETATVSIPAAAGGTALVALENGSQVISRNWVSIAAKGETKYSFTVTKEMSPNCYVHISLLQPHSQTINELPIRMYGIQPMIVSNKNAKLEPQIIAPDVIRPETEFTVKVSEKSGKPMTYTLAVVDEGLLDLTNFKTPNAANEFFAREALGIRTWDMYDNVIGAFGGRFSGMLSVGGDEALKQGNTKANRFKPVVKFLGPFTLDGGSNSHKIKLPQYVGSVRIMVVAGQNGAYGNAEKTSAVRAPLMILSSLPRVLSVNEQIMLPVNVFALENSVKNVSVSVKSENNLVKINDNNQSVDFAKTGDKMLYFSLKTTEKTGVEKITVTAQGNGQKAVETIEIQVRNPNAPVVVSQNKILNSGETVEFAYNLGKAAPENFLRLEAAYIPTVDISRQIDFLYSYQHYCSEQITSRAFPMLYFSQFKDISSDESNYIKTNILQAIQKLYSRQMSNGGFRYWDNSNSADDWITSYIGHFLVEAKAKGYTINEGVLKKWKTYQQTAARSWSANDKKYSEYAQAYRLYTLALSGSTELGAMNRLKENKTLAAQSRWLLASAYALDGKVSAAQELIFNVPATMTASNDFLYYTYGDNLRDDAMILQTMTLLNRLEDAFKQAQRISQRISTDKYLCTQSTAFALMAIGNLAEKTSGSINYDWTLNGKNQKTVKSSKAVMQTNLALSPSSGKVSVKNNEKGILYVSLTQKIVPLTDTLPEIAENLKLQVSYRDINGNAISPAKLAHGTDFYAVVRVENISLNDYENIALTHIIPAGWEIAVREMQGINPAYVQYQDLRDDRILTYFNLHKGKIAEFKIRLQASYIGTFTLPAIRAAAMYNPEAQARTKAETVEVVK